VSYNVGATQVIASDTAADFASLATGGTVRIDGFGIATFADLDVAGEAQCNSLRIDQTAGAGTVTPDSHFHISLNGTSYAIPCVAG